MSARSYVLAYPSNHCCQENAESSICITKHVAAKTNILNVAMLKQQYVPFVIVVDLQNIRYCCQQYKRTS